VPRLPRLSCALLLLAAPLPAQLASPGRPVSERAALPDEIPLVVLPGPDVPALMAEDELRGQRPYRYGALLRTSLGLDDSGRWDELPDGTLVWRLALASPGALSLGVLFDEYELPDGARLFLHDRARSVVLGAFTAETRQPNGMLAVQPLAGDELVIEYSQDPGVLARPRLSVGEVVHDYRGILGSLAGGASIQLLGTCLLDANCPEGGPYQDIKRATIEVLLGGFNCSAALLNNTAQDGRPYFLTANHCGDMTNTVAVFGFENTGCGTGGASQMNTISGATLRRASSRFDSQLYELSHAPPQTYAPFYAGWDRSFVPPAPGISLSHPSGLPKKLALDEQAPLRTGDQWEVQWELGMLQGGSSGSPLFNGLERVIGPACCVSSFTCNAQIAFYGRLGGFYNVNNLAPFLDPLGLGVTFLGGHDPFGAAAIPYNDGNLNPVVYRSLNDPTLGTTWLAEIDASAWPAATSTWILGYAGPGNGTVLGIGALLVDTSSPRHFKSLAGISGGLSQHTSALPMNPALIGVSSFTQGLVLGGGVIQLTNAVELRLR
jgi:hypothetical protein